MMLYSIWQRSIQLANILHGPDVSEASPDDVENNAPECDDAEYQRRPIH